MNFRKLLRTVVLPALLLMSAVAFGQQAIKVTGRVTDSKDGSALSGVSVIVKGTSTGTSTDVDGAFTIQAPSNGVLIFSSVGFADREVAVAANMSVSLVAIASSSLNEVVVIAYGSKKKSDLTGAVTSIGTKDFQKGNIASSEQLLQGKVPGLQVTTGGGSAGGGSRIRIRSGASLNASNDPLIVVDGVPVDGNGLSGSANLLNTINPNDIESMSVLKDASATALYGSRASNGVIIITTKKGSKGRVKLNFNTMVSAGNVAKKLKVFTGDEIRAIVNADAAATDNNQWKNLLGTANTDWQDQVFQTAMGYDNNLSASGALGSIPFRASLGYFNQDGILKTNNFGRVSTSLNLTPKFFKNHLSVNVALKSSWTNNRFVDEGGVVGAAASFDPTQEVRTENKYGNYWEWMSGNIPNSQATRNPLGLLELRNNTSDVNRLIGNIQLDYKLHFLPDLHVLVNAGIDRSRGSGNDIFDSTSATNFLTAGRTSEYKGGNNNTLLDLSLFYEKDLKSIRSKIDVLVGHSYQDFSNDIYRYAAFSQRGKGALDTIAGSVPVFKTDKLQNRLESYFGRVNFSHADKYLLTASVRRDASSKFGRDFRVGYFPAAAFAWRIKEEFFKSSKALNDFKLRLGWGITGQQDGIDRYSYLPYYAYSSASTSQYQLGDNYYSTIRPLAYDRQRKWEQTTTYNAGIDFAFANNRISGSVDYYFKKTKDLLSSVDIAPGANLDIRLLKNVGNVENNGFEFALNTTPVKTADFTWDFGFNFTWQKSRITNLLEFPDPSFPGITTSGITGGTGNNVGRLSVGYSPYVFYLYKQVYDKSTGAPIQGLYEDMNRDGAITDDDRYYYKKPAADFLFGINTQVAYKKWSLGLAAHGTQGNYLYNNYASNNGTLRNIKNPVVFIGNASTSYNDTKFTNNQYLSDYYVENASFIRLDNINLGYNAGRIFRDKASLRIAFSVQNVFVITKYKGLDPESANDNGVDYTIYPRPRIVSLGLNLDF